MTKKVEKAVEQTAFKNLGHAAARIRKDAVASIVQAEGPSPPGTPPHTHTGGLTKKGRGKKGALQKAIAYDVQKWDAEIGPRHSIVGDAGQVHEFGQIYRGEDFPARPYMWPALEKNVDRFASDWEGSIGE